MKCVPHESQAISLDDFYKRIDESSVDSKNGKPAEAFEINIL